MWPLGSRLIASACWLACATVLLAGAWLVCHAPSCSATTFDVAAMNWLALQRTALADQLLRLVTWLGSLYVLAPLALLAALLLLRRRKHEAYFLVTALASTVALIHLSKLLISRPRPMGVDALIAVPWDQSFPSAHSAQIACVALAALLLQAREQPRRLHRLWPAALVAVTLVGFSRVYLQVHYPSDVIAGIVASGLWVMGLAQLMLRERRA